MCWNFAGALPGLRVVLADALSPMLGENGIWMAIPIGWAAADVIGYG
ncbi:MAG: hypothetical protein SOT64_05690 [Candidatus Faecousia sp.]|nr:hypothetical protein [Bacillota bacterium]MDD7341666.1 hypothetical protein [Bacillota bacterium]MDY2810090.1 hypothetical protein [Candidatus Faecousia sp.]